jgi:hypothetical protein
MQRVLQEEDEEEVWSKQANVNHIRKLGHRGRTFDNKVPRRICGGERGKERDREEMNIGWTTLTLDSKGRHNFHFSPDITRVSQKVKGL